MNDNLRQEVKLLKALQDINYKEVAEYLEVKVQSFYSWLNGSYDFGYDKTKRLREIINCLKE